MLILLSPAKKLLQFSKPYEADTSTPIFLEKAHTLVTLMQSKTVDDLAGLMDLSPDLAELNYHRYQQFDVKDKALAQFYPALFLFQGDVYQGLQAKTWDQKTIDYAQKHLRILSGLYGLLSPLDNIQPYRLEMGVRLANPEGKNLYDFWRHTLTHALNQQLAAQQKPIVINLASAEYFKAVNESQLNYPVIQINFYERKNNQLKIIGIHAKKARGAMARYLIKNQIDDLIQLKEFHDLGYIVHEKTSSERQIDFVRNS